jgi:exodeoxyribonuclease V gamma subunit
MELANRQRISANLTFPFPNAFLSMLCERLSLKTAAPEDPFDPTIMAFTIMKKLPACLSRSGYETLRYYFQDDKRQTKLLQLSQRIAHLFDQYLVFRPDTITGWDRGRQTGQTDAWQGDLWRAIAAGNEHLHRVSLHKQLIAALENDTRASDALPERVSVFGISYLPAFHLEIMTALSKRIPVNWYFLSPCRQYWGEVVSDRDIRRIREKYAHEPLGRTDLHLDQGNPLLASMGTLGRDFLSMIAESGCDVQEHYATPGRETLLNSVQSDILDMLDATNRSNMAAGDSGQPRESIVPETDNSIEIHVCHSPMREIEILHDHILDAFQCMPDLKPRDILVMTPDIDTYAPFIQAVFENSIDAHGSIPFSLADRSDPFQSRIMDAFFTLLDLGRSRMEADKIIGLLDYPALRKKFNMDEPDTATIGKWVRELNIRWGVDEDDRKKTAVPFFTENTWKSGLDRLLLGYAMPGQERNLFAGLLPYDHVEGDQGRLLGSFLEFFTCVLKSIKELQSPKTLHAWATTMHGIVDGMFLADDTSERELTAVKRLLGRLEAVQQVSGFDEPVELETVACHLQSELGNASFGSGFLAGKVTFCAMLPMRSIPFKVICLIGMHGTAFPRDDSALGFDLMAAHPKRGDRSRRNDDKYLFLEALVSARNKFYISYIGRDIQDNSPISPSVVVSELIDYVGSGYAFPEDRLVRQHPLQAFSADYFNGRPDLFSYSAENFTAAVAARQPPARPDPKKALPEPSKAFRNIDVKTLGDFYANPTKYFLQNRLGIYLEKESTTPDSSENFRMGGLETYTAGQESLQWARSGRHRNELMKQLRARGMLPPGRIGEHDFSEIAMESANLVSRANTLSAGMEPADSPVSLRIGEFGISGSIPHVQGHGLVHVRFANFNPRDLVLCWINHLLLCAGIDSPGLEKQGFYLCRNASVVFEPPENCRSVLHQLLTSYWDGLARPLPFFPKSAYAYARSRLIDKKSPKHSLQAAYKQMQGTRYTPGEIQEPYVNFYCGDTLPLDERFETMSLEVFEPLFDHHTSSSVAPPLQLKDAKHL